MSQEVMQAMQHWINQIVMGEGFMSVCAHLDFE